MHDVLFTTEYIFGIMSFVNSIRERFTEAEQFLCSCRECMNRHTLPQDEVERHLLMKGMSTTYTRWINHGEPIEVHVLGEPIHHDGMLIHW